MMIECSLSYPYLSKESSMLAVNWGSTRSGKCLDSHADTIIPFKVGTDTRKEKIWEEVEEEKVKTSEIRDWKYWKERFVERWRNSKR